MVNRLQRPLNVTASVAPVWLTPMLADGATEPAPAARPPDGDGRAAIVFWMFIVYSPPLIYGCFPPCLAAEIGKTKRPAGTITCFEKPRCCCGTGAAVDLVVEKSRRTLSASTLLSMQISCQSRELAGYFQNQVIFSLKISDLSARPAMSPKPRTLKPVNSAGLLGARRLFASCRRGDVHLARS